MGRPGGARGHGDVSRTGRPVAGEVYRERQSGAERLGPAPFAAGSAWPGDGTGRLRADHGKPAGAAATDQYGSPLTVRDPSWSARITTDHHGGETRTTAELCHR